MIEIFVQVPRLETLAARGGLRRPRLHLVLEQHVHEHVHRFRLEDQGSRRTATGTLQVWATLRNRTNFRLQVEVRVQFFDADKGPLEGPTAWQRVMLPANTITSWQENSIGTTQVAYYFGEIREGR